MKESELRKHATCSICNTKILARGVPLFWRVTIERFGVDMRKCERQHGLTMMLGSAALASVMGLYGAKIEVKNPPMKIPTIKEPFDTLLTIADPPVIESARISGWRFVGNRFVALSLNDRFQRAWDSLNWPTVTHSGYPYRMIDGVLHPPINDSVFVDTTAKNAWWDSLAVLKNDPHWRDSLRVRGK